MTIQKEHRERLKRIEDLLSYERLLRRKRGLEDLYFFNRDILEDGYPDRQKNIVPHVQGEWWEWYKNSKKRLKLILVPRGTLKSTFFTIGGTLQKIAQLFSDNTGITGADRITNIVSLTQSEYDALTPDATTLYIITG